MPWNTPKTNFADEEILTHTQMNEIGEDLEYLYDRPSALYESDTQLLTSSTSFVDMDGTNLDIAVNTNSGNVLVWFTGALYKSTAGQVYIDLLVDGTSVSTGSDGLFSVYQVNTGRDSANFAFLVTGLSAGSHDFKLQWKVSAGTVYVGNTNDSYQYGAKEF